MKKLLLAIALLLLPATASAQCTGVFPANNICGTTAAGPPGPVPTSVLTGVPGGNNGQIEYNNSGFFGGFTMAGDCTVSIPNITCVKVNGVTYGASPATDTVPIVTASNTTTYTAIPNCPSGSILNYTTSTHLFSCNSIPVVNACPIGYFCRSQYGSTALAVAAINTAGKGTLYYDQTDTAITGQAISSNTNIKCAAGVKVGTTSTTASMFTFASAVSNIIEDCYFTYAGTPGTKTAGYLLDLTTLGNTKLHNLTFDPYCFVCIHINSASDVIISNVNFAGNISAAPASGLTGLIQCDGGEAHISNLQSGASATNNFYAFGVANNACSLDFSNFELTTQTTGFLSAPGSGKNAFSFVSNGFIDNPGYGVLLQPAAGGVIGYSSFTNMEIGINSSTGTAAVAIDNTNGSTGITTLTAITSFNYTDAQAAGVSLACGANPINLVMSGSTFGLTGARFFNAFSVPSGCTAIGISANNNSFLGSSHSISLASVMTNSLIQYNRLNGGAIAAGGNSTTNVNNNLP